MFSLVQGEQVKYCKLNLSNTTIKKNWDAVCVNINKTEWTRDLISSLINLSDFCEQLPIQSGLL